MSVELHGSTVTSGLMEHLAVEVNRDADKMELALALADQALQDGSLKSGTEADTRERIALRKPDLGRDTITLAVYEASKNLPRRIASLDITV